MVLFWWRRTLLVSCQLGRCGTFLFYPTKWLLSWRLELYFWGASLSSGLFIIIRRALSTIIWELKQHIFLFARDLPLTTQVHCKELNFTNCPKSGYVLYGFLCYSSTLKTCMLICVRNIFNAYIFLSSVRSRVVCQIKSNLKQSMYLRLERLLLHKVCIYDFSMAEILRLLSSDWWITRHCYGNHVTVYYHPKEFAALWKGSASHPVNRTLRANLKHSSRCGLYFPQCFSGTYGQCFCLNIITFFGLQYFGFIILGVA